MSENTVASFLKRRPNSQLLEINLGSLPTVIYTSEDLAWQVLN